MKQEALFADSFPFVNELLTKRLRLVVFVGAMLALVVNLAAFVAEIAGSRNYLTPHGQLIGGDFVVFDAAGDAAVSSDPAKIYDAEAFSQRLGENFPQRGPLALSWQYPPTMLLLASPLALSPYAASFALWAVAGLTLFLLAMRPIAPDRLSLFTMAAAPASFQALITGQTGFFTAALLATAAGFASRRPILAGIAAGLLTVKPQLGLLIPLAFAAGGCWRAFAAAALTAIALAASSYMAFGADIWTSFSDAVLTHAGRMQADIFPFEKMLTPYGAAMLFGAASDIAMGIQLIATTTLVAFVALLWRRVGDWDLRIAILCSAAPLATPYAFYYEMTIALPALLVIARRGGEQGWLSAERAALALVWLAPMFVLTLPANIPWAAFATMATFALVARRAMRTPAPASTAAA
jgi:hypothetical protein